MPVIMLLSVCIIASAIVVWHRRARKNRRLTPAVGPELRHLVTNHKVNTFPGHPTTGQDALYVPSFWVGFRPLMWRSDEIHIPMNVDDCVSRVASAVHPCWGNMVWLSKLQDGELFYGRVRPHSKKVDIYSSILYRGFGAVSITFFPQGNSCVAVAWLAGSSILMYVFLVMLAYVISLIFNMELLELPFAFFVLVILFARHTADVRLRISVTLILREMFPGCRVISRAVKE